MSSLEFILTNLPHISEKILVDYASYPDMMNCLDASDTIREFYNRDLQQSNIVSKKVRKNR